MNFRNHNFYKNGESFIVNKIADYYLNSKENNLVVFDIGSNIGNYAEIIRSRLVERKMNFSLYCFEPLPASYKILREKFLKEENIRAFNVGIGKSDSIMPLYSNHESSELASMYKQNMDYVGIEFPLKMDVQIRNLDSFCSEHAIHQIHFLKMDTEGSEFDIIRYAPGMMGHVDFIQFEFGTSNVDSRTFLRDFFEVLKDNYELYRILKDGLYPYNKYHQDYEVMVLCNYLAVSKRVRDFKIN